MFQDLERIHIVSMSNSKSVIRKPLDYHITKSATAILVSWCVWSLVIKSILEETIEKNSQWQSPCPVINILKLVIRMITVSGTREQYRIWYHMVEKGFAKQKMVLVSKLIFINVYFSDNNKNSRVRFLFRTTSNSIGCHVNEKKLRW